jgi:ribosome-binding protein aMBF1 (putative translation factor)
MTRPGTTLREETGVRKTTQPLRRERGESRTQLMKAFGVKPNDIAECELGTAESGISRMRTVAEHFGVRDDETSLKPGEPPTLDERLADAF